MIVKNFGQETQERHGRREYSGRGEWGWACAQNGNQHQPHTVGTSSALEGTGRRKRKRAATANTRPKVARPGDQVTIPGIVEEEAIKPSSDRRPRPGAKNGKGEGLKRKHVGKRKAQQKKSNGHRHGSTESSENFDQESRLLDDEKNEKTEPSIGGETKKDRQRPSPMAPTL